MTIPAIFQEFATLLREYIHLSCPSRTKLNSGEIGETTFNRFAVALFRLQFAYNNAYRRVCETRKLTPRQITHWQQIPAVPAAAFKELDLSCLPADHRAAVFHSSGTTGQRPSRHFHNADSLALYEASLSSWFGQHILPEFCSSDRITIPAGVSPVTFGIPYGLVLLSPSPVDVPRSSLVHMFATIARNWKWSELTFLGQPDADRNWTVNARAAAACLQRATDLKRATVILGTAFSFVHLLDEFARLGLRFQLPAGSRVMETGGYKGRSRTLTRPELHSLITERLGISSDNIICEYGMTELSSQAYDRVYSANRVVENPVRCFQFPPWARTQIISPETGEEVSEGDTGLLRVCDLANVYSVLAIQTEDLGIRRGAGFELLGRAAKAEPRGCSLASL